MYAISAVQRLPRKKNWLKCQCLSKTNLQQVIKPWHVAWTLAAVSADPFRSKTATKRCFRDAASPTVKEVLESSVFSETIRLIWQVLSGFLKEKNPFLKFAKRPLMDIPALPTTQIAPSFLRTPYPPSSSNLKKARKPLGVLRGKIPLGSIVIWDSLGSLEHPVVVEKPLKYWIFIGPMWHIMASICILKLMIGGLMHHLLTGIHIYVPWKHSGLEGDWILRWGLTVNPAKSSIANCCWKQKTIHGIPAVRCVQKVSLKVTVQQMYPTVKKSKRQMKHQRSSKWNIQNKKHENMPSKYIQRNNREERMKKVRWRTSLNQTGSVKGGFNGGPPTPNLILIPFEDETYSYTTWPPAGQYYCSPL